MSEKVYVLTRIKRKDSFWQLPEEDLKDILQKIDKARESAGGVLVACFNTWSSQWRHIHLEVFPDMDEYHEYHSTIMSRSLGINARKYFDLDITLGRVDPAHPPRGL